jgi:hypothetical protein
MLKIFLDLPLTVIEIGATATVLCSSFVSDIVSPSAMDARAAKNLKDHLFDIFFQRP